MATPTKKNNGRAVPDSRGKRFAIVVGRYHEAVASLLAEGAMAALRRGGCGENEIVRIEVPGAFEIPLAAKRLAESSRFDAVICLGCVIRGETPHFKYVADAAARGVQQVALQSGVPITFGVLTVDTLEQAMDRAGGKVGNKGEEAALAAIEMADLFAKLSEILLPEPF